MARRQRWHAGWTAAAAIAVPLILYLWFYARLWMHYPPVWPDEGLFANAALNLIQGQGLATTLVAGLLPGAETHTYWVPPAYLLLLAGVFKLFGVGIEPMRLLSLALGLLTAALLAALLWIPRPRSTRERLARCAGLTVLLSDRIFLRGSIIGRMDILAVAIGVGALCAYRAAREAERSRGRLMPWELCGALSALAVMSHPMGVAAPLAILADMALSLRERRLSPQDLLAASLAGLACLAPWAAYILQDPMAFRAQIGGQMARKASMAPESAAALLQSLRGSYGQYGSSGPWAMDLHLFVAVGLLFVAWRECGLARLAMLWLAITFAAMVRSHEMWYPLYLAPPAALGAALVMERGRPAWKVAVLLLAAVFAGSNWSGMARLAREARVAGDRQSYSRFCEAVSGALPEGSRALLCSIPDPYLGLLSRADLRLRHFLPTGIPISYKEYEKVLREQDYILIGDCEPGPQVRTFLARGCVPAGAIGRADGVSYTATLYRVSRTP